MFHLSLHLKEELYNFCYGMTFFGMFFFLREFILFVLCLFFLGGGLIDLFECIACNFRCVLFWVTN